MYNVNNAIEQEQLQAGIIIKGIIIQINDGIVKDFINEVALAKWLKPEETAIELVVECQHEGNTYKDTRIMPYRTNTDGNTVYSTNSNLGKYNRYYKKLPEVGDQVQMKTNANGFFKIIIE